MLRKLLVQFYIELLDKVRGRGLGRIWFLRRINDLVSLYFRTHHPKFIEIFGNKIYLPLLDGAFLSAGYYEKDITELVRKELKKGDVFVDLGANIGYYTLLAAKLVGQVGKVYAFEPAPENFNMLMKNITANRYLNITAVQKAISDTTGTSNLFLSEYNKGDHRLYDPQEAVIYEENGKHNYDDHSYGNRRKSVSVGVVTLDGFLLSKHSTVDFMKIDIQGFEGKALYGAALILKRSPKLKLVMEFWPGGLRLAGTEPAELIEFLIDCGFSNIYLLNDRKHCWSRVDNDRATTFYKGKENIALHLFLTKSGK